MITEWGHRHRHMMLKLLSERQEMHSMFGAQIKFVSLSLPSFKTWIAFSFKWVFILCELQISRCEMRWSEMKCILVLYLKGVISNNLLFSSLNIPLCNFVFHTDFPFSLWLLEKNSMCFAAKPLRNSLFTCKMSRSFEN